MFGHEKERLGKGRRKYVGGSGLGSTSVRESEESISYCSKEKDVGFKGRKRGGERTHRQLHVFIEQERVARGTSCREIFKSKA